MREIRFRAWDNLQKKFEYWDAKNDKYDGIFWSMIRRPEFGEPEQYTGLKDRNSTEIYKGDKLQDVIDNDTGTVYWKESAAGFYVKWGDGSDVSLNYGVATCKCEIISRKPRTT